MECSPFCVYQHSDPNEYCDTIPDNGWGWTVRLHKRKGENMINTMKLKRSHEEEVDEQSILDPMNPLNPMNILNTMEALSGISANVDVPTFDNNSIAVDPGPSLDLGGGISGGGGADGSW